MAATGYISGSDARMAIAHAWRELCAGIIGSAADKSGAGPKPQPPRSRARAKSVHGVSHKNPDAEKNESTNNSRKHRPFLHNDIPQQ
jgi:hypothetical protein